MSVSYTYFDVPKAGLAKVVFLGFRFLGFFKNLTSGKVQNFGFLGFKFSQIFSSENCKFKLLFKLV